MKIILYTWNNDTHRQEDVELNAHQITLLIGNKEFDIKEMDETLRISVDGNLVIYPRASNNIAIDVK